MNILERSINQDINYGNRSSKFYQDNVLNQISGIIGIKRTIIRKWRSNLNSDFYIYSKDSIDYIIKMLVSKPTTTIEKEYLNLVRLFAISNKMKDLVIPSPILLLSGKSAYVSKMLKGVLLSDIIRSNNKHNDKVISIFKKCGKILATIHNEWSSGEKNICTNVILEDFTLNIPWRHKKNEKEYILRIEELMYSKSFLHSYLYQDYDPVNLLLLKNENIGLLDPPESDLVGPVHWDIGCFILGIKRAIWRSPIKMILKNNTSILIDSFIEGYNEAINTRFNDVDYKLINFFELVRLAQLWLWWKSPWLFRYKLFGFIKYIYSIPLLKKYRNDLIKSISL